MNIAKLKSMLNDGVAYVEQLTPLATAFGGAHVAAAAKIITVTAEIAQNVLDRIEEAQIVATSDDRDDIKAIVAKLADANDVLNAAIVKS